eukprot:8501755-Alexandrium_andersonii.AAC.1
MLGHVPPGFGRLFVHWICLPEGSMLLRVHACAYARWRLGVLELGMCLLLFGALAALWAHRHRKRAGSN